MSPAHYQLHQARQPIPGIGLENLRGREEGIGEEQGSREGGGRELEEKRMVKQPSGRIVC